MTPNDNLKRDAALNTFFVTALQEMYWAETNLVNVLTTMTEAASTEKLKDAFRFHTEQTKTHRQTLQDVLSHLDVPAQPVLCIGLQGLFDEGWQVIDETPEGSAQRDVALIIAAQKVEHYEIATYGSLITLANTMAGNGSQYAYTDFGRGKRNRPYPYSHC